MDSELIIVTELTEEEWLLRSFPVPDTRTGTSVNHYEMVDGKVRISRGAFNDSKFRPSVDRLCKLKSLQEAQFDKTNAVVKLSTTDVITLTNKINNTLRRHFVIDDPTTERPAHAKIMSEPPIGKKPNSEVTYWKHLRELLAIAASKYGWVIPPSSTNNTDGNINSDAD